MKLAIKTLQHLLTKVELKESIRTQKEIKKIERNKLIEDSKRIGIDKIIRQNERITNNLKSRVKYKTKLSQCLECKKLQKA